LGLAPAASHSTSSSRAPIGVASETSRAIRHLGCGMGAGDRLCAP
jgi:hypothetical protein